MVVNETLHSRNSGEIWMWVDILVFHNCKSSICLYRYAIWVRYAVLVFFLQTIYCILHGPPHASSIYVALHRDSISWYVLMHDSLPFELCPRG